MKSYKAKVWFAFLAIVIAPALIGGVYTALKANDMLPASESDYVAALGKTPFDKLETPEQILGATSALLMGQDGHLSMRKLGSMLTIIEGPVLAESQSKFGLSPELLAKLDRNEWRFTFSMGMLQLGMVDEQNPPFTADDISRFESMISAATKHSDNPEETQKLVKAVKALWPQVYIQRGNQK